MNRLTAGLLVVLALLLVKPMIAETWYVRADGGDRGRCNGKADSPYPGHGSHQPCAFNDIRWLWDDQHSYNSLKWVIAGGDTVILDNTKQWRIGFDTNGTGREKWCYGWHGGPYGCFNPTIPSGTPTQHTRILGRNHASCSVDNAPDKSKMTQIFGGHGVGVVLNLKGAQYVDVDCLEITRHSQCIRHGTPAYPSMCRSSAPLDDYDGDGIATDVDTRDVLLQDLWIHGHTDRGIIGPIGGEITANRLDIDTNGMAGWDFDNGNGTPSVNGVLKMSYTTIEWSGCNQEYPAVSPIPVASCYGQSTGGYGDGIGTPSHDSMNVYIDHSVFRYNTQDGEDFGHVDTGSNTLRITDSMSYANNGGQFKWGPNFTNVLFANNIAVGNCLRMSEPITGAPSTYNAHLADFCRAEDAISFNFRDGGKADFLNNTIVSYSPTTFDIGCSNESCSNSSFVFRNNIVLGYNNPKTFNLGGKPGGPGGFYFDKPIGHVERSNNLFYGLRSVRCESTELCQDPKFIREPRFVRESDLDHFDVHLEANSPARHTGIRLPEIHTDFDGKARPSAGADVIGAIE